MFILYASGGDAAVFGVWVVDWDGHDRCHGTGNYEIPLIINTSRVSRLSVSEKYEVSSPFFPHHKFPELDAKLHVFASSPLSPPKFITCSP